MTTVRSMVESLLVSRYDHAWFRGRRVVLGYVVRACVCDGCGVALQQGQAHGRAFGIRACLDCLSPPVFHRTPVSE